jgi:hypothetical protein
MITIAHKQPGEDITRSNLSSALVIPDDSFRHRSGTVEIAKMDLCQWTTLK